MTTIQYATVEIFLRAFEGLTKAQRQTFLEKLLHKKTYRQDLLDLAIIEERRHEPQRPFRDYLSERSQRLNR